MKNTINYLKLKDKNSPKIIQFILLMLLSFSAANGAGELDSGFSASVFGGIFNGTVNAVKVQPNGKILVGGHITETNGVATSGIARLNSDGSTDTSFDAPDFYSFSIGREIWSIAVQADGKILVGGNFLGADNLIKHGLIRLNPDGSIDTSFNNYSLPTGSIVFDIEIQTDNKILIGGLVCGVFRLNSDGTFDNTFAQSLNGDGSMNGVEDLDIQPDGKIVVAGRNLMRRVTANGELDSNFNQSNSFGLGSITTLKVRADGKILVGGSFQTVNGATPRRLCLFNSDGSLDTTFNSVGPDRTVNEIVLKPDGKFIIGGEFINYNGTSRLRVAQINADGSLDTFIQFNVTGAVATVTEIELQPDGKLLAGNQSTNNSLIRFNSDGSNDSTFSAQITRDGTVNKILQQSDEKILALGDFTFANGVPRNFLARFKPDGTLDTSFVPAAVGNQSLAIQTDGKILVGGNNVRRLNTDGSLDTSFTSPTYTIVNDILPLANGQILIAGGNGNNGFVIKLNSNGSVDTSFTTPLLNQWVYKMLIQPTGKIIIGGDFNIPGNKITRLNTDGSFDNTFTASANATVYTLGAQLDGKILVGGQFTSLNGSANQVTIGRLNADGTLDTGFVQSTNGVVRTIKALPDGKILLGGTMSAVGGAPHNGIARLIQSGAVDNSFNTFANSGIRDINLQSDGKILLGGSFTKINRLSAVRVARLFNTTSVRNLFDYDGDGKADVSVFRPSENRWYIFRSSDGVISQTAFAITDDKPVPADFDGDGKTDIAIFRPASGDWWSLSSSNNSQITANLGNASDIKLPSDFDGDGRADYIIFRPSNNVWYRLSSGTGMSSNITFGLSGDKPVSGDFDGDGKSDVAIYRPSTGDWWYQSSINGAQLATRWGISTDIPVPADYDGDGKTDFAVYRASTGVWYIYNSSTGNATIMAFGLTEDKPVAADYDGDGKADIAVFRPSTGIWYQMRSTSGFMALQFGISTDIPTPNAYIP